MAHRRASKGKRNFAIKHQQVLHCSGGK
jgi:hypothetical protein